MPSPTPLQKTLIQKQRLEPTDILRTGGNFLVSDYRRLHFTISGGSGSASNLHARVLFGTVVGAVTLLADGTVWAESGNATPVLSTFEFTAPANYNRTSFVLSVPVIARRDH
jgi:hypothetical protein